MWQLGKVRVFKSTETCRFLASVSIQKSLLCKSLLPCMNNRPVCIKSIGYRHSRHEQPPPPRDRSSPNPCVLPQVVVLCNEIDTKTHPSTGKKGGCKRELPDSRDLP